jgi:hypothetical protein
MDILQALNQALQSAGGANAPINVLAEIRKSYATKMAAPESFGFMGKSTFNQSGSATSGLTFYDLEAGAKFLYPVLTPLRNMIPRVSGRGGIQAAWRAITGVNVNNVRIGVSPGNRNAVQAVTTADYTAAYKGIGTETSLDFEAQYAAENFDDVRAIAGKTGLQACMLGEEVVLLGGNNSVPLGLTPTPSLTAGTAGFLSNSTLSVICVALALEGFIYSSVLGGIPGQITRLNADGSTDTFGGGSAQKSAAASITLSGGTSTQSINATVAAVNGALGYAWFSGVAGSEVLTAITSINSVVLTAAGLGTQTAASLGTLDNSTNNLEFDGLLTQALKAGSNAYVKALATGVAGVGSTLTGDGSGGVVEIEDALQNRWDNYRLGFDTMWVSSQQARDISKKILAGGSTGAQRFVFQSEQNALGGGVMIATYLNKYSMGGAKTVTIKIHPNMPSGTILFTTSEIPYPLSGVGNIIQVRTRQEYYQIEWPLRSRKYEYGVYADEVVQNYFPPSMGVITNIAPG